MNKIAVLVDSGCQIEIGSMEDKGIFVVPLTVTINDKTYLDEEEITSLEVFKKMEKDNTLGVKTSQPSTGIIEEYVNKIKDLGYKHIIALPIATGLSSTLQGMKLACDMAKMPVTLVDTKGTAGNQRYLALLTSKLVEVGKEINEIVEILENCINHSGTVIMVPNLDHLARGGRITPGVARLAGLLKIVPIMELNYKLGGKIDTYDKVRTVRKANIKIIDHLINDCGVNAKDYIFTIEHVLSKDLALAMKEELKKRLGNEAKIRVDNLPSVVGAHMGIGGIGYQYIKKYVKE
ncbi:MAG: DegV family protein [Thomasclavelia sp.]|jgi:DegV family protein with EDD domain|nr:DegV family protein [Thomasclavelia sp.]